MSAINYAHTILVVNAEALLPYSPALLLRHHKQIFLRVGQEQKNIPSLTSWPGEFFSSSAAVVIVIAAAASGTADINKEQVCIVAHLNHLRNFSAIAWVLLAVAEGGFGQKDKVSQALGLT